MEQSNSETTDAVNYFWRLDIWGVKKTERIRYNVKEEYTGD